MSDGPSEPALRFLADLRIDVDGVQARVHGDGPELVVETDHPVRLAQAARRSLPATGVRSRAALRGLGDRLAAEGVSIAVRGPRGRLVAIGAGADSRAGAVLAGTRRVHVDVPPAVSRLVAAVAATVAVRSVVRVVRR